MKMLADQYLLSANLLWQRGQSHSIQRNTGAATPTTAKVITAITTANPADGGSLLGASVVATGMNGSRPNAPANPKTASRAQLRRR